MLFSLPLIHPNQPAPTQTIQSAKHLYSNEQIQACHHTARYTVEHLYSVHKTNTTITKKDEFNNRNRNINWWLKIGKFMALKGFQHQWSNTEMVLKAIQHHIQNIKNHVDGAKAIQYHIQNIKNHFDGAKSHLAPYSENKNPC